MKILLVEDDMALAMGIEYSLNSEGYEVEHLASYQEGISWMERYLSSAGQEIHLGLFDVMLPDGNGFELLTHFRKNGIDFPVIFLTAVSDEVNVVQGLELGADDYIAKPFRVKELISRIKAVARRYETSLSGNRTHETNHSAQNDVSELEAEKGKGNLCKYYRDVCIDPETVRVTKQNEHGKWEVLELTASEYRLLLFFVSNQGIVLERSQILERIFDGNGSFVDDNTLSVYIKRLREKIGDNDKNHPYIKTIRGVGYMMEKENVCE